MIAACSKPLSSTFVRSLLKAAGRAPSPDNNQPWAFRVVDDAVEALHCRSRAVPSDVQDLFSGLAMGAAIENIVLEASRHNFRADLEYAPRPFVRKGEFEPVAKIRLTSPGTFDSLSGFIDKRTTNRKPYRSTPVAPHVLRDMSNAVEDPDCDVNWLADRSDLKKLSAAVQAVDRVRFEHEPSHDELHGAMRFGRDEAREAGDGIEVASLELPRIAWPVLRWLSPWDRMEYWNRFGLSRLLARRSASRVVHSGAVGLLTTERRDATGIVQAGRALQRIWLTATARGLAFQPMGALPLFLRRLEAFRETGFNSSHLRLLQRARESFQELFPAAQASAGVMLFRVGHSQPPQTRSCRLPVDEISR